jgi:hypothetical protein
MNFMTLIIRPHFFVLLIFLFIMSTAKAQNETVTDDYKVYQKQHQQLSCGVIDSMVFQKVLHELLALDTTQFTKNLDVYHRDLMQAYSSNWLFSKNENDLRQAVYHSLRIKNPISSDYWNLASHFVRLKDCEQGMVYLDRYLKETPAKQLMPSMDIWILKNDCKQAGTDDYKVYRDSQLKLSCTLQDSATISTKLIQLQLLDTTQFTKNMDAYYQDLGWAFYRAFPLYKDSILLQKSISSYLKQKELSSNDLWNIAFTYYLLNECDNGAEYLERYRRVTPSKIKRSKKKQIARMKKRCA